MDILLQNIIIGLALVAAVSFLLWRWRRKRRQKAGCPSCPAYKAVTEPRPQQQGPPRRPSTADR